jgi:hypothetical protein
MTIKEFDIQYALGSLDIEVYPQQHPILEMAHKNCIIHIMILNGLKFNSIDHKWVDDIASIPIIIEEEVELTSSPFPFTLITSLNIPAIREKLIAEGVLTE